MLPAVTAGCCMLSVVPSSLFWLLLLAAVGCSALQGTVPAAGCWLAPAAAAKAPAAAGCWTSSAVAGLTSAAAAVYGDAL